MKHLFFFLMLFAAAVFFSGCMSYEYDGVSAGTNTGKVAVFTDSAGIRTKYKVLGKATVSGNYREISREKMMSKLTGEAAKCGADAILIVEQQVIPDGEMSRSVFDTSFSYDDSNRSWNKIDRDVSLAYGNIRNKPSDPAAQVQSYRRIIRAEFLQYLNPAKENLAAEK